MPHPKVNSARARDEESRRGLEKDRLQAGQKRERRTDAANERTNGTEEQPGEPAEGEKENRDGFRRGK